MKKPTTLIATGLFPPQVGGPATYSKLLLERLPDRGFTVKIQSFGWVIAYPKGISHLIYFLKIFFGALQADIVYAQDPVSVGLPSLIAAKILRKRFFLKIVGDYAWEQGSQRSGITDLLDSFSTETEKYPFLVRALKKIQLLVANNADTIIVPSNYLKQIVTNWGIHDPAKIKVIYNAFNEPHIDGDKITLRKKLNFTGPIITSAGRLVPWKGFDTVISLMPEIAKQVPGVHLFIAGDGPDKAYLQETIKKAGAEKFVTLTGKMPQKDLFEYIKASDLFVLNTSYEGFSHQILEVLALGTPLITTRAGGNVEIIESEKNGILVEYNDTEKLLSTITQVLTSPDLAQKFTRNGREKLGEFTEERMLSGLIEQLSR